MGSLVKYQLRFRGGVCLFWSSELRGVGVVEKEKFSVKNWRSGIPGYSEIVLGEVKGKISSKLIHLKTW